MTKVLFVAIAAALVSISTYADSTWVYAVQTHAEISTSPPQITLRWRPDDYGAKSYTVYRKQRDETSWGAPRASLSGDRLAYTDTEVSVGSTYEYQVIKDAALGYKGYGYIFVGIEAPLVEDRGSLVLVTDTGATAGLGPEMDQLRSDLRGDGWQIREVNVSSNTPPQEVRAAIKSIYQQDPARVNTVFLLGHVAVPRSGNLDWDTHGPRSQPADAYYGNMTDEWTLDPATSPSYMPSEIELRVGRVDFFDMPGLGASKPWPGEIELLRQYLGKAHRWRHKQVTVPRRALMGNLRGDEAGGAPAASGYRVFDAFVGPDNVHESDVSWDPPMNRRWISILSTEPYLWAWGGGGGSPNGCGGLGTNVVGGVPGYLYSKDVVAVDAKAVFLMLFGSWFGQWDLPDNFMRSFLATKSLGLASFLAGRPHWFTHHMAMGEPIGYSARLTMNNTMLYRNQSNGFPAAVYVALMGDPTLRMEPLAPPANLAAAPGANGVSLSWQASADPVAGYHVYRASNGEVDLARITPHPVLETSYLDAVAPVGTSTYMVKAVVVQQNHSGSYWNSSQGVTASATRTTPIPNGIQMSAQLTSLGIVLTWNSQPGLSYRVQTLIPGSGQAWTDASPSLWSNGTATTWTDALSEAIQAKLYRVRRD